MKFVKQTRLLGIIIDDSLSWSYHIDSVCCKVGRKIGALRRSFRLLTPHARRTFYISVIQPDLEYAALTFTPSMNAGLRNRLLAVWRKAIRCAAGVRYQDEVTPLLSEFRLTNIVDRWIVQFACHVRRCVKQEAPSTSCAKLQRPAHRHCTRGQENIPFVRSWRTIVQVLYLFRTVLHFSGTLYLLTFGKHHHRLLLREGS